MYLVLSSFISSDDNERSFTNSLVSCEIANFLNFLRILFAAISSCLAVIPSYFMNSAAKISIKSETTK